MTDKEQESEISLVELSKKLAVHYRKNEQKKGFCCLVIHDRRLFHKLYLGKNFVRSLRRVVEGRKEIRENNLSTSLLRFL